MSDKPDVAALTDEQCDEFWFDGDGHRGPIRAAYAAGRASLQANVPADIAALIARLIVKSTPLEREAADALQSQQERIAELERALRIFDPGLNSLDAAIAARKP